MAAKDLRKIIDRVPKWPKAAQDELLRSMTEIETRYSNLYQVTDADRAALDRSAQDVRKGLIATDEEVESVFGRFHRT